MNDLAFYFISIDLNSILKMQFRTYLVLKIEDNGSFVMEKDGASERKFKFIEINDNIKMSNFKLLSPPFMII